MVKVLSSFVRGPLEPHVMGFADDLFRLGYSRSSASQQVCFIAHLDRWMSASGVGLGELSGPVIERYPAERQAAGYVEYRSVQALRPVLDYLAPLGVLPGSGPPGQGRGPARPVRPARLRPGADRRPPTSRTARAGACEQDPRASTGPASHRRKKARNRAPTDRSAVAGCVRGPSTPSRWRQAPAAIGSRRGAAGAGGWSHLGRLARTLPTQTRAAQCVSWRHGNLGDCRHCTDRVVARPGQQRKSERKLKGSG